MAGDFLKADLHLHSSYSFDGRVPPKEIVEQAKRKGLDIVGITDHGTIAGAREAKKYAKGITVLIGQETKTLQGDILVFNVNRNLEQKKDILETCKAVKKAGGFIVIPHPFDPLRSGTEKVLNRILPFIDAIEGFNSRCFFGSSNRKAEHYAAVHGIPAIASSDAHRLVDIGRSYTLFEGSDLFRAIRNGRIKMVRQGVGKVKLLGRKIGI